MWVSRLPREKSFASSGKPSNKRELMKTFLKSYWGVSVSCTALLLTVASIFLVWSQRGSWLWAVWGAWVWLGMNSLAIFKILEMVRIGGEPNRQKIFRMCLIKFPVLYLMGFSEEEIKTFDMDGRNLF